MPRLRAALFLLITIACRHDGESASDPNVGSAGAHDASVAEAAPPPVAVENDIEFLAAGDIADCDPNTPPTIAEAKRTGALLAQYPNATIAAIGDLSYPNFTTAPTCFADAWGKEASRVYPAIGNHEHIGSSDRMRATKAYFDYWETVSPGRAGARGEGWYSYDRGSWHIVALNSDCQEAVPWIKDPIDCSADGPQMKWLKADLEAQPIGKCTLAYFHHPVWSMTRAVGSPVATPPTLQDDAKSFLPFWEELYKHGVDVVLTGHLHYYARTVPLDAAGNRDDAHGMRFFVAGMGGSEFYNDKPAIRAGTIEAVGLEFGVVRFVLKAHSYLWEFLSVNGAEGDSGAFTDKGSGDCHDAPLSVRFNKNATVFPPDSR